jgi:hypothetical protein
MLTRQRLLAFTVGLFWIVCLMAYSSQRPAKEAGAAAPECPDLSGRYMIQGEDGQVHISIQQERCDRITIRREIGYLGTITGETHVLKLNGTAQDDPPWFGGTEQYKTSAKFNDAVLQIEGTSNAGTTLTVIYSLNLEGDLLEKVVINGRGGGAPTVAKREK